LLEKICRRIQNGHPDSQATPAVSFTGAPTSAAYGSAFAVSATTNTSTTAVSTAGWWVFHQWHDRHHDQCGRNPYWSGQPRCGAQWGGDLQRPALLPRSP
jgi:hypothetical protein